MKLIIQQGRTKQEYNLPERALVEDLHVELEQCGVFRRNQKLIFKGKVLQAHKTLQESQLCDGAKLTLMVSGGQTLGQAEAQKAESQKLAAQQQKTERDNQKKEKMAHREREQAQRDSLSLVKVRSQAWKQTGIIALRDFQLTAIPQEVWQEAPFAHTADFTNNQLTELPAEMALMTKLHRLNLSRNLITSWQLPKQAQPLFSRVQVLSLSNNRYFKLIENLNSCATASALLETISLRNLKCSLRVIDMSALCVHTALKDLDLSNNQIRALPPQIADLTSLQHLNLACNAVESLPPEIGSCLELIDMDFSQNQLSSLPEQISKLQLLKNLQLSGNLLEGVPAAILRQCQSLQTLNLHRNRLTITQLRESTDYKLFDQRRRLKYTKQMEMRLMSERDGFDEGADQVDFHRWGPANAAHKGGKVRDARN